MNPSPPARSGRASVLLLLALAAFHPVVGPGARAEQLHQLLQVEGSAEETARFLADLGIPFKSDTVYVFVIPPMVAARLEGAVNPFIRLLRKTGVQADIMVLAVHNRRRAAERYLERRNFAADHIRVTDERFLEAFVLSAGSLQSPFATKFCVESGELISSYSLLGVVDSATVARFVADSSRPRALRPEAKDTVIRKTGGDPLQPARRMRLLDTDTSPLSTAYYLSINPSGSRLALRDDLTNHIFVFDLATGELDNVLYPDSSEETMFVSAEVPGAVLSWLKRNNIINSMYFSHDFLDDSTLTVTASLPSVEMEVSGTDTNFGYRNAAVLVTKRVRSNKPVACARFTPLPDTVSGGRAHIDARFVRDAGFIFLPFEKGWPKTGTQMLDEDVPPEDNPFSGEFYARDVHQFAAYNYKGEFAGFWGRLNERFRKLKLGYIAAGGLARRYGDKYYLADVHFSGRVYVHSQDGARQDSIIVYEEPPIVLPDTDPANEPLRYLLDAVEMNFGMIAVDLLIARNHCFVLLLDRGQPVVYRADGAGHNGGKFPLPAQLDGSDVRHHLLRDTQAGIVVVSLAESADETWYCEYLIPDGF
ncbi:MAG: hypothetical protein R6X14_03890 [bacterium]